MFKMQINVFQVNEINLPEYKIDVENNFSTKGITPAAEEEGTDNREQMINYALIYLNILHLITATYNSKIKK